MINSIKNKNHLIVIISSVQITHLEQHDCVLVDVSATAIDVINIHSFFLLIHNDTFSFSSCQFNLIIFLFDLQFQLSTWPQLKMVGVTFLTMEI